MKAGFHISDPSEEGSQGAQRPNTHSQSGLMPEFRIVGLMPSRVPMRGVMEFVLHHLKKCI